MGNRRVRVLVSFVAIMIVLGLGSCHLLGTPDGHYYVSPDGWDFARGTENSPWQSLEEAGKRAEPGDTIHILPGTYNEYFWIQVSGEPGNPITFVGHDGAVLDGTGLLFSDDGEMGPSLITMAASDYIVIENLEVIDARIGVAVNDSSNIEIRSLTFTGIDEFGIQVVGSASVVMDGNTFSDVAKAGPVAAIQVEDTDGFEITGNQISDAGLYDTGNGDGDYTGDGIITGLGSSNGVVSGNTIDDVAGAGIALLSHGGRTISGITIANNTVSVCDLGIDVTFAAFDGNTPTFENVAVVGNSVSNVARYGILVSTGGDEDRPVRGLEIVANTLSEQTTGIEISVGNSYLDGVEIANNLIVNSSDTALSLYLSSAEVVSGVIVNNTVVNDALHESGGLAEIAGSEPDTGTQSITIANNIFTGTVDFSLVAVFRDAEGLVTTAPWDITHNLFTEGVGAFGETHGDSPIEVGDALFLDAINGDYSLASGSPARDAGTGSFAPDEDIVGTSRPQGSEVDVGAFEYVE